MALIQRGSPDDLVQAVQPEPAVLSADEPSGSLFAVTENNHGLSLKSIKLTKDFGFFAGLFNPAINIYFIAWAWDYSGSPVIQYPPAQLGFSPESLVLTLRTQEERSFLGTGIMLFPPRKVTAGINVCINLWQSTQDVRAIGTTLGSVAQTIQSSMLNQVLSTVATITATPAAAVAMATNASLELTSAIGNVLKTSNDQHLDLFQGTYDATQAWISGDELNQGHGTEITITHLA
jgi:hypothetical protein